MGNEERLKIFFLDVGQGDCTFIVPPEGDAILVDCADRYTAERFVANHGIVTLAAVVASHLDVDHIRGLLPFLKQHFENGGQVKRLLLALDRIAKPEGNVALRDLLSYAIELERNPPHRGFTFEGPFRTGGQPVVLASAGNWSVELVLPWYGTVQKELLDGGRDPNSCSAVIRVVRAGTAVLIGGDAPLTSWQRLEPRLMRASVIRVPHHGGDIRDGQDEWTRDESNLYEAVKADTAVISVGTHNSHGHPAADHVRAALRKGGCRLLCTQLTPRCHKNPAELRDAAITAAAGVEWPYRHWAWQGDGERRPKAEVPCAGSVVISLDIKGEVEILPGPDGAHQDLLDAVDDPMCRAGFRNPTIAHPVPRAR